MVFSHYFAPLGNRASKCTAQSEVGLDARGTSLMVEQEVSNLLVGVRFSRPAPLRKLQVLKVHLASLGDRIVRSFRGKKKFPIPLEAEKKNLHKDLGGEMP